MDYLIVEINPAFGQQAGIKDLQGPSASQIAPGARARFETKIDISNIRWLEVYAYCYGDQG